MNRKMISHINDAPMAEKSAVNNLPLLPTPLQVAEGISFVWFEWRRQKLPLVIFILLCVNLLIAPAVYAADGALEPRYAYALGLLGLVTLGLVAYLFVVVFQPERF
jgi:K+-transporting ATPase KdpF subunit